MFTGIISEIGVVKRTERRGLTVQSALRSRGYGGSENTFRSPGLRVFVHASQICRRLKSGDSVNIDGVCQTVVDVEKSLFGVEVIPETLRKTKFSQIKVGDRVNLEAALTLNESLSGHFVLGHVDCTGQIARRVKDEIDLWLFVDFPPEFSAFVIPCGSIAIDGVSLTIAEVLDNRVRVAVIPHTAKVTTLGERRKGDLVNLEFDLLGKYLYQILSRTIGIKSPITPEWLKQWGWTKNSKWLRLGQKESFRVHKTQEIV